MHADKLKPDIGINPTELAQRAHASKTPTTLIARSDKDEIFIRGIDLIDDLIGELSFIEMFLLEPTGQRPGAMQTKVLNAVPVTLMEHGMTPSAIDSAHQATHTGGNRSRNSFITATA